MKPVLVLQHLSADGPAYLGAWLQRHGQRFEVHNAEAGDAVPDDLSAYSALAILGGEMSANDPLPALRGAERLILQALERGVPAIGHCLGGQLMARALGARVVDSPAPEIGWQAMRVFDVPQAAEWFGAPGERTVFQWHYEAFELPPDAVALAGSPACPHQAFTQGSLLAMQFHIEVDADKLGRWTQESSERFLTAARHHASVQSGPAMRSAAPTQWAAHRAMADRIYSRWLARSSG